MPKIVRQLLIGLFHWTRSSKLTGTWNPTNRKVRLWSPSESKSEFRPITEIKEPFLLAKVRATTKLMKRGKAGVAVLHMKYKQLENTLLKLRPKAIGH